jgi:hypothetical protein
MLVAEVDHGKETATATAAQSAIWVSCLRSNGLARKAAFICTSMHPTHQKVAARRAPIFARSELSSYNVIGKPSMTHATAQDAARYFRSCSRPQASPSAKLSNVSAIGHGLRAGLPPATARRLSCVFRHVPLMSACENPLKPVASGSEGALSRPHGVRRPKVIKVAAVAQW